jgi:3-oxoadipate enol-lactonase
MADGVLLLHAFPLDASMWVPQVSLFGPDVPVAAPSFPGFGGEPPAGGVMTMAAAAERAASAARAAGITSAMVCGLSMGGYVALELWRQEPDLVAGLVLANTRGDADDAAAKERREQLAARLRAEGSGFMVESPPPLLSEGTHPARLRLIRNIIGGQPADSIAAAALGMAARRDSMTELERIGVPTLVISSTGDRLIPPEISRPLAEGIPGARFAVIEGAGHLSNFEAAPAFNSLLLEHWQSL